MLAKHILLCTSGCVSNYGVQNHRGFSAQMVKQLTSVEMKEVWSAGGIGAKYRDQVSSDR